MERARGRVAEPSVNEITKSPSGALTEVSAPIQLEQIARQLRAKPFVPHRIFSTGDLQTLSAYFWPGRFRARDLSSDEARLFQVAAESQVLARCRWQPARTDHPTLLIWHGMEGSTSSAYMLTTAAKAFRAGFNVVRFNLRNCGDTEHLTPSLYHAGLTDDLRVVIDELIDRDGLKHLFAAGFSLGGNMVLKLGGEYGEHFPEELKGICAISPSVDLRASADLITEPRNRLYQQSFLKRLKQRIRAKARQFPELYDVSRLRRIRTIEQFDNRFVAPAFDFADADDYYAKASALPYIKLIRVPTLIIHAQDDPFIPFAPLAAASANPNVILLAPERGGHVAFIAERSTSEDRFWAERQLVEFCRLVLSYEQAALPVTEPTKA